MKNIPFTSYDYFGVLSAGFAAIFGVAFAVYGVDAFTLELGVVQGIALGVGAYVAGHIVAAGASLLLEKAITERLLGTPAAYLMREDAPPTATRVLFSGYATPLPAVTRDRVTASLPAQINKAGPASAAAFHHCYGRVIRDDAAAARVEKWLNLYGFSRNTAMAFLITGTTLAAGMIGGWVSENAPAYTVAAFAIALLMYRRYLKFYRQHAAEVYLTYAELPDQSVAR